MHNAVTAIYAARMYSPNGAVPAKKLAAMATIDTVWNTGKSYYANLSNRLTSWSKNSE